MNRFRRLRDHKVIFGIFSGLEKFLKTKGYTVDRYCLRAIYVLLILFMPIAISWCLLWAYIIVGIILPYEGDN